MEMQNPFRHQMAGHLSCEGFNQTNLDDLLGRDFANFEVIKSTTFCFYDFYNFPFDLGRNCRPPGIVLEAAGACKDQVGGILCFSDFSRNQQIMKIYF